MAVSIHSARKAPVSATEASFQEGFKKVNLEIKDSHGKVKTVQDTRLGASLGGILFSSHLLHALLQHGFLRKKAFIFTELIDQIG